MVYDRHASGKILYHSLKILFQPFFLFPTVLLLCHVPHKFHIGWYPVPVYLPKLSGKKTAVFFIDLFPGVLTGLLGISGAKLTGFRLSVEDPITFLPQELFRSSGIFQPFYMQDLIVFFTDHIDIIYDLFYDALKQLFFRKLLF